MRTYEELAGATGRRVFYRAERFAARDVFTRFPPRVLIDGVPYTLDNLSMSGLAASGAKDAPEPGRDVAVVLEGDGGPLFSGTGRLSRVEPRPSGTLVAVSFKDTSLDITALIGRHTETLIRRELNGGLSHALDLVPAEYRRFCADVMHLLRAYRTTLGRFENLSRRDDESAHPDRIDTVYALAEERILPEWRRLWREGNALTLPMMDQPEVLRAVKAFTERVLTPEFMGGAIWNRSYRKPLGYPGDYQIMNYVYEWLPRGATVYDRLLHRLGLDVLECVATRMVMARQAIAAVVEDGADTGRPARVMSLGCGPAQEVVNYLSLRHMPRAVDITLVDQDHQALDHAYSRVFPEVLRHNNGSTVRCLEVSFVELVKGKTSKVDLQPQDLIYSVGLVDYLPRRRALGLVRALYGQLAPGGELVIGNAAEAPLGGRWSSEFICDWSMFFRTETEMAELAMAAKGARWELRADPTGRIHMLYLTRPSAR